MGRPKQTVESATDWGWALVAQGVMYVDAVKENLQDSRARTAARLHAVGGAVMRWGRANGRGLLVAFAQAEPEAHGQPPVLLRPAPGVTQIAPAPRLEGVDLAPAAFTIPPTAAELTFRLPASEVRP